LQKSEKKNDYSVGEKHDGLLEEAVALLDTAKRGKKVFMGKKRKTNKRGNLDGGEWHEANPTIQDRRGRREEGEEKD